VFDLCEARFKAEQIDRARTPSGDAANLGTACHGALEDFVASGEAQSGAKLDVLIDHYGRHYWSLFDTDARLNEGAEMLRKWHKRTKWDGVTVLSTEQKQSIEVPVTMPDGSASTVTFNFIIDRLDQLDDGSIRVVDYKSQMVPMTYEDLRSKPQPTLYGMLAKMHYPQAPVIWVQFDFLRHDAIGVRMTDAEHAVAWQWLKTKAQQVIDSDGTQETLNLECGWCARKGSCTALRNIVGADPLYGMSADGDLAGLAEMRVQLAGAKKAIESLYEEATDLLVSRLAHEGVQELETDQYTIKVKSNRRRSVDGPVAARIAGADVYARYSKITLKDYELMIARENFTPDQATALQQLIQMRHTGSTLEVKPKGPVGGD
jgi:hypothetical protein